MKSTPGPWKVIEKENTKGEGYFHIAIGKREISGFFGKANAKLIAAAPELLEALILILPLARGYVANHQVGSNQKYIEIAEQTITKTEGD